MKKAKLFTILAVITILVGVIVAFNAELNTTTIYDPSVGAVTPSIGTHVIVIMLFVIVSDLLLLVSRKSTSQGNNLGTIQLIFHGMYAVAGLFFSLATAYQARANNLTDFYSSMKEAPYWYFDATVDGGSWFDSLPQIANEFSSSSTTYYILTFIAMIATIVLGIRATKKAN